MPRGSYGLGCFPLFVLLWQDFVARFLICFCEWEQLFFSPLQVRDCFECEAHCIGVCYEFVEVLKVFHVSLLLCMPGVGCMDKISMVACLSIIVRRIIVALLFVIRRTVVDKQLATMISCYPCRPSRFAFGVTAMRRFRVNKSRSANQFRHKLK